MYNYNGENMKKIVFLIIFLLSFLISDVSAKEYKYVLDQGNILKDSTEEFINTYSEFLNKASKIDYYVITIDNLGEYDLDNYADIVYTNLINPKKDNGLLILVSKNDRRVKVIAGRAISGAITDEVIDNYLNEYFLAFLSNNEWDTGIKNGYIAFFKYICLYLNIDTSSLEVSSGYDFFYKYRFYIFFVCIWICNTIGYILPKYFIRMLDKHYKVTHIDNLILYGSVFINVIILYYNYIYVKKYLFILLAFELFSILSGTVFNTGNSKHKVNMKNK